MSAHGRERQLASRNRVAVAGQHRPCAGPRCDSSRHRPICAGKHCGIFEVEGESVSSRPNVDPLGLGPGSQAAHQFLIGAKHDNVGVPKWTCSCVVNHPHALGGKVRLQEPATAASGRWRSNDTLESFTKQPFGTTLWRYVRQSYLRNR